MLLTVKSMASYLPFHDPYRPTYTVRIALRMLIEQMVVCCYKSSLCAARTSSIAAHLPFTRWCETYDLLFDNDAQTAQAGVTRPNNGKQVLWGYVCVKMSCQLLVVCPSLRSETGGKKCAPIDCDIIASVPGVATLGLARRTFLLSVAGQSDRSRWSSQFAPFLQSCRLLCMGWQSIPRLA